ncbi:MAG: hypothetical protein QNK20_01830 [Aureibaculum sp.]|nr:hypothetical protein [Aureibaculum sp.]
MDQLEILKKDWKKQEGTLPKLSKVELTKLIYKKSSSVVKWIFIISILEFVVPYLIILITGNESSEKMYEELGLSNFMTKFYIMSYVIIFGFILMFYKNYRMISANANPKVLIQNIIKTRKTVKYYIWFNLVALAIISVVVLNKVFISNEFLEKIPEGTNMIFVWLISMLLVLVLIALLWLFYRLIYGILLNKLKVNYNELVSNEINEL